jgi:hypothetical protein
MKVVLGILIFMSAIACFAQEMPEPALTETIPDASTCDGMKTYVDLFALKMQERPASTGLIVITPDQNRPERALRFQMELRAGIAFKRFGNNIPVLKFSGHETEGATATLYFLDKDSAAPGSLTDQPVLTNPPKRFFYNATFSEACAILEQDQFAAFLLANPNVKTEITIYDDVHKRRKRTANLWFRMLTKNYQIEPTRIRLVLRNEDHANGWSTQYAAFWITS